MLDGNLLGEEIVEGRVLWKGDECFYEREWEDVEVVCGSDGVMFRVNVEE